MAYYPVENDHLILGYRLILPDEGKIDKIDVISESVDFELKHIQIIKEWVNNEFHEVYFSEIVTLTIFKGHSGVGALHCELFV